MKIERVEDIEAWPWTRKFTCKVYDLTKKTKFSRDFGLKGQIQEAAGSSMHNIAEANRARSRVSQCINNKSLCVPLLSDNMRRQNVV